MHEKACVLSGFESVISDVIYWKYVCDKICYTIFMTIPMLCKQTVLCVLNGAKQEKLFIVVCKCGYILGALP